MGKYVKRGLYIITLLMVIGFSIQVNAAKSRVNAAKPRMVLAGSSSIRMWHDAKKLFKDDYKVINRAIGDTKVIDWLRIYKREIVKYKPDVILFYCGANDIEDGHGTTGIDNAENTKKLFMLIRRKLKKVKIVYISINHCNRNTGAWHEIDMSNGIMREFCGIKKNMYYVDIVSDSLLPDGTPDPILFRADQLHPSKQGFQIWNKVIGQFVNYVL